MSADVSDIAAPRAQRTAAHAEVRGLLEVVLAMAFAGSSVVVGKLLSTRVPVFLSVELSLCAALVAILPAQIARWRELRLLGARELGYMFLQAVFGIVLFRVFTLSGLHFTSALSAGVITSAAPAVMAVLAALVLRERLGRGAALGVVLSVAGLVMINLWSHQQEKGSQPLVGNLLVLAATMCEALLTVFRKSSGGRIGSITNTTVLVSMSALMILPFAALDLRGVALSQIDAVGWLSLIYYGAVATVIAYILWGHGALRIPANRTGIATAALPVTALILSALVLGEPLGPAHFAGCAAVIAGIILGNL
ncbi:MAG TPA: DMT family transporter [Spirochaetia bacterium]|nr:DMT family transporter [Spirochaetia bacterium]